MIMHGLSNQCNNNNLDNNLQLNDINDNNNDDFNIINSY